MNVTKKHDCEFMFPESGYGSAANYCYEDDNGKFWIGNGEYGTQVNYCPKCGTKATTQIKEKINE